MSEALRQRENDRWRELVNAILYHQGEREFVHIALDAYRAAVVAVVRAEMVVVTAPDVVEAAHEYVRREQERMATTSFVVDNRPEGWGVEGFLKGVEWERQRSAAGSPLQEGTRE